MNNRQRRRDEAKRGDAAQFERELRNRLHDYEQKVVIPLRVQIAEMDRELASQRRLVATLEGSLATHRQATEALIRLCMLSLDTGK